MHEIIWAINKNVPGMKTSANMQFDVLYFW